MFFSYKLNQNFLHFKETSRLDDSFATLKHYLWCFYTEKSECLGKILLSKIDPFCKAIGLFFSQKIEPEFSPILSKQ